MPNDHLRQQFMQAERLHFSLLGFNPGVVVLTQEEGTTGRQARSDVDATASANVHEHAAMVVRREQILGSDSLRAVGPAILLAPEIPAKRAESGPSRTGVSQRLFLWPGFPVHLERHPAGRTSEASTLLELLTGAPDRLPSKREMRCPGTRPAALPHPWRSCAGLFSRDSVGFHDLAPEEVIVVPLEEDSDHRESHPLRPGSLNGRA